jgi:uncharacterized protein (TIRG00374 family)
MRRRISWSHLGWLVWIIGLTLLVWVLRRIPLADIHTIFSGLHVEQLGLLAGLNAAILGLFAVRWWLLLRGLDQPVPFSAVLGYRLAAFGINYFTPGPQFGGEPLQVALLSRRQRVPAANATASVALDKLLELAVNLGFLASGLALILSLGLISELTQPHLIGLVLVLLALPVGYLALLFLGRQPLSAGLARLPQRFAAAAPIQKLVTFVYASETRVSAFCRAKPQVFLQASLLSLLGWLLMILEFWLTMVFLGMPVPLLHTFVVMTAARLAFLAPTPGGLGALEAALVLAVAALGFPPAAGFSLALLIRGRDLLVGLIGLIAVGQFASGRRKQPAEDLMV